MSPEVLDGVTSNLEDSRLAVDLYALALVMWEIMSRCNCTNGKCKFFVDHRGMTDLLKQLLCVSKNIFRY